MSRRHWFVFALLVLLVAAAPAPSRAACTIDQLAQFPVTMAGSRPLIPVKVNGSDARLIVDSGAFYSMLSRSSAAQLKLKPTAANVYFRRSRNLILDRTFLQPED